jgi:hypothetical protein
MDPAAADALVYKALSEFTTPLDEFTDGRTSLLGAAAALGMGGTTPTLINQAFDSRGMVEGWDVTGSTDATVLRENVVALGFFEPSPPAVSGEKYVVADVIDKANYFTEPSDIFVGNVDGTGTVEKVSPAPEPQVLNLEAPDISGDQVVWGQIAEDPSNVTGLDSDVILRHADGTLEVVAGGKGWQKQPSIDGNLIAWQDDRRKETSVWARYLGEAPVKLSKGPKFSRQFNPQVSGDWVAWFDEFKFGIQLRNMSTGAKRFIEGVGVPPALGGGYVAWQQPKGFRYGSGIFVMNLETGQKTKLVDRKAPEAPFLVGVSLPPFIQVNSEFVVYVDERGFVQTEVPGGEIDESQLGRDIWMVPVAGGTAAKVTCNRGDQTYPAIGTGGRVLWFDTARARTDLMTDIGTESC